MQIILEGTTISDIKRQIESLHALFLGPFVGAAGAKMSTGETTVTTAVVYDIELEEKPAPKQTKKSKDKKETVAEVEVVSSPTETTAAVNPSTETKEITLDVLRTTLQKVATKKGLGEASKVLSKFKARTLKEILPANYEKFHAACNESLA